MFRMGAVCMETILMEVLKFIGASMAGGITWDILKEGGNRLFTGFKNHFVNAGHFQDESQAEEFLKEISSRQSLNKRRPLEDVWTVYDNCTGREADVLFQTEFKDWINHYREELERIGKSVEPQKGIFIQKQINKDNAQVTNIGNQYNYGGAGDKGGDSSDK